MNIAMVGGGGRCLYFMNVISTYRFPGYKANIVAVADIRENSPGIALVREKGIHTTNDYRKLAYRADIEVFLNLTGQQEISRELHDLRRPGVLVLNEKGALEFFEDYRIQESKTGEKLDWVRTRRLCDLIFNELVNEEVMVIDSSYTIIEVNNAPLKKYGLERWDVIGRRCYEISHHKNCPPPTEPTPCSQRSNYQCPIEEVKKTGKPFRCTHIHYDKEGRRMFHSISSYPIFECDSIVGIVQLARDITWEASMQKSFSDQEKLSAIGRLAAGVAHELNNPLTTVLTSTLLLQEDLKEDDPMHGELELISHETMRCRKIVTNLLNFARQSAPVKQEQDINGIVSESMALVRKQADFNNVSIELDLHPEPILLYCDRDHIQQCLINLGLNAIDATPAGGKVTFSSGLSEDKTMACMSVEDTGSGFSQEVEDAIFEPFFTTKETGTGLGLSITHGFVRQHRGFIKVATAEGQGSTFTIRIPFNGGECDE